jgi:hypothetical protein
MSGQKMKPCSQCGSDFVGVYKYESGWRYVECDARGCWYRGPGEGSIKEAIKSHNERVSKP